MVDDVYLNGYAKYLGTTASMIYFSICRHADKQQTAFPPQSLIANELGINEQTVKRKMQVLKKWQLISIEQTKSNKGQWLHNTYTLLDKSEWKIKPGVQNIPTDTGGTIDTQPEVLFIPIKETHTKDTHNTLSMSEDFLEKIAGDYQVPISFVKSKLDDMTNYCSSKGKTYKDYGAALRNWVKQDAIKLIDRERRNGSKFV